ncbi:MAG TPA: FlgD immunoglobulin-like domain containing protein [Bacteroidota bacterium]|nr:FlgD immunoglobulin-like domain containing protein [Bacteroidota bacterium]
MKLKPVFAAVVVLASLAFGSVTALAQPDASRLWIRVYGPPTHVANMWFGNRDANNTMGIDSASDIPTEYKESETPPPPFGFEAIWAPIRPSQFGAGVRGLLDNQFNGWADVAQKDTFRINFAPDDPDQTISFKWITGAELFLRCDSAAVIYFDPDLGANRRINMNDADTLDIPAAGTNGVGFIRIFKYGAKKYDTDVRLQSPTEPKGFQLRQNYPNPFNPTTIVTFDIQKMSRADVSVYNVLGQKIATLVSGELAPGTYTSTWEGKTDNGLPVSSGIYFVRMSAQAEGTAETYTAMRKLLLMK